MASPAAADDRQMPLDMPPPRNSRFGAPLVLSRVHWVRPEQVAEVKFLTWTEDNLLRQVVYQDCARTSRRPRCAARCPFEPYGEQSGQSTTVAAIISTAGRASPLPTDRLEVEPVLDVPGRC